MQQTANSTIAALDVGAQRIGIALTSLQARLPRPYMTLRNGPGTLVELQKLINAEQIELLVVGLPRNLSGQETEQTRSTRDFVGMLEKHITIPVRWQDETLTSKKAEEELRQRGKPFEKGDVDALAATYILEDYLQTSSEADRA